MAGYNIVKKDQAVSRQLTEPEVAVEKELQSLTDSRPEAPSHLGNIGPYDIMSDESRARRAKIEELQQMQQMSYLASARRELHDRTVKENEFENEMTESVDWVANEMKNNPGMSGETAISNAVKRNPKLIFNPNFARMKEFTSVYETDSQRENTRMRKAIEDGELFVKSKEAEASAQFVKDNPNYASDVARAIAEGNLASNQLQAIETQTKKWAAEQAKNSIATLEKYPDGADNPGILAGIMMGSGAFNREKDKSAINPVGAAKYISKNKSKRESIIGVLYDPVATKRLREVIGDESFDMFVTGKNAKGENISDDEIESIGATILGFSIAHSERAQRESQKSGKTQPSKYTPNFDSLSFAASASEQLAKAEIAHKAGSDNVKFSESGARKAIISDMANQVRIKFMAEARNLPSSKSAEKEKILKNMQSFKDLTKKAIDGDFDPATFAEELQNAALNGVDLTIAEEDDQSRQKTIPNAPPGGVKPKKE